MEVFKYSFQCENYLSSKAKNQYYLSNEIWESEEVKEDWDDVALDTISNKIKWRNTSI